jgi:hypothetical protein
MMRRKEVLIAVTLALAVLGACGGGGSHSTTPSNPPSAPLSLTTTAIPDGVVGKSYTASLTATGGKAPYTWTVQGPLPPGLSLASNGSISGTPTSTWSVITGFTVTDSSSPVKTSSTTILVTIAPELVISTNTIPDGHINAPYDALVQAIGPAVNTWTVSTGQLPPGMQLSNLSSSQVVIAGTTTQTGSYTFTVQAQSVNNPPQVVSQALTMVVDAKAAITTTQVSDVVRTVAYSSSLAAVNGTPPYQFTALSPLPAGLALSSGGQISGTVGSSVFPGTFPVTFQVTDSAPSPSSSTRTITINLVDKLQVGSLPPAIAILNQPYGLGLFAVGGRTPYSWSIASGAVPPGTSLNSQTGMVSGIPKQLGTFTFNVQVQDSTNPPQSAVGSETIQVVPPPLSMPISLPSKIPQGVAFDGFIAANGGTPPYTWTLTSGTLPTGLGLNNATGEVSGTPTALGHFDFVARTTDSGSPAQTAQATYGIDVTVALGRNDSIQKATAIGNGSRLASISPYADPTDVANPDVDYYKLTVDPSQTVSFATFAKGSNANNPLDTVIEVVDANGARLNFCNPPDNPSGTFVSPCLNDDLVQGVQRDSFLVLRVPGQTGTQQTVYLKVFDWAGSARPDMVYSLSVSGAIDKLIALNSSPNWGQVNGPYVFSLVSVGGFGSVSWTIVSGSLPPGLTMATNGLISGTPTTAGTYSFTARATDSGNPQQTASVNLSIQINP